MTLIAVNDSYTIKIFQIYRKQKIEFTSPHPPSKYRLSIIKKLSTWLSRSSIFLMVSCRQDLSRHPFSDLCGYLGVSVFTFTTGLNCSICSINSFSFYFCAWSSFTSALSRWFYFSSSMICCSFLVNSSFN